LNETNEAKDKTVRVVADFWKYNPQFLEIILDKLVNYRVVEPSNIITWILSDIILSDQYTHLYVWSILRNTLKKVVLRVQQIKAKLEYTKKLYREQEEQAKSDGNNFILYIYVYIYIYFFFFYHFNHNKLMHPHIYPVIIIITKNIIYINI